VWTETQTAGVVDRDGCRIGVQNVGNRNERNIVLDLVEVVWHQADQADDEGSDR